MSNKRSARNFQKFQADLNLNFMIPVLETLKQENFKEILHTILNWLI